MRRVPIGRGQFSACQLDASQIDAYIYRQIYSLGYMVKQIGQILFIFLHKCTLAYVAFRDTMSETYPRFRCSNKAYSNIFIVRYWY